VYKANRETWSHGEGPLYNITKINKYDGLTPALG